MADDAHRSKISKLCRLCGKIASSNISRPKEKFEEDLKQYYGVNVEDDSDAIHPSNVCGSCVRFLYRLRKASSVHLAKIPFTWEPHNDSNCSLCTEERKGRPNKKRKRLVSGNQSGTDSGEEPEDESEKESCNLFRELSQNLHRLDIELARELCQNICSPFGLAFIDPEDMFSSVKNLERQFILQLVETIFCLERENL